MPTFVGIDWSENLQDWYAIDADGEHLGHGRVHESVDDFDTFDATLRGWADPSTGELPVISIETERGLLVTSLRQRGYTVFALNPLTVHRFRPTQRVSRAKSDQADARLLADIIRLQPGVHRPLPAVTDLSASLYLIGRTHQAAVWRVQGVCLELRSVLRQFFPAALAAWKVPELASPEARTILAAAPTPTAARALTPARLRSLLRRAGRSRYIERDVKILRATFTAPTLTHPAEQEAAFGLTVRALVHVLDGAVAAEEAASEQLAAAVTRHPMFPLFDSIKGCGLVTAGRLLGEIGDDPQRFDNAASLRAYAGTAPVTVASGKSHVVRRRHVKNNRLSHTAFTWAMVMMRCNPPARAYYDRRRDRGDKHAAALRNMSNRMLGCLWHCMVTGEAWDDAIVWHTSAATADVDQSVVEPDLDDRDTELRDALEVATLLSDGEDAASEIGLGNALNADETTDNRLASLDAERTG